MASISPTSYDGDIATIERTRSRMVRVSRVWSLAGLLLSPRGLALSGTPSRRLFWEDSSLRLRRYYYPTTVNLSVASIPAYGLFPIFCYSHLSIAIHPFAVTYPARPA